ncbi:T2EA factor, partial [Polypterus senegalus]
MATAEQETPSEVPAALKRLAKYIVRGFYDLEHFLTLDLLIRFSCIKEDDLLLLLKFEKKQLRAVLATLKADKIIKSRMRVETAEDGKSTRHSFYYINYKVLVDVVKYRLDLVRRRIESDERESSNRASFRCPVCSSTFSDLEVNHLFDPGSGEFRCTYCCAEVQEDASALPKQDSRTLLAKFNEQIEPIYLLLRETEDVVLPFELLEPEPTEISGLMLSMDQMQPSSLKNRPEKWSKNRSVFNIYEQEVVVSLNDSTSEKVQHTQKVAKECPIWMTQSTVEEAPVETSERQTAGTYDENGNASEPVNEVIQTLLIHEKKSVRDKVKTPNMRLRDSSDSDTSESEEESLQSTSQSMKSMCTNLDEAEVDDEMPMVFVAGQPHLYSEVSEHPELVSFMTPDEKETYIQIGKTMFQAMFD